MVGFPTLSNAVRFDVMGDPPIFSHFPFTKGGSFSPPFAKGRQGGISELQLSADLINT